MGVIGILEPPYPTRTLPAAGPASCRVDARHWGGIGRARSRGRGRGGSWGRTAHWLWRAGASLANQRCRGRSLRGSPGEGSAIALSGIRSRTCGLRKSCQTLAWPSPVRPDPTPARPAMGPQCRSLSVLLLLLQVRHGALALRGAPSGPTVREPAPVPPSLLSPLPLLPSKFGSKEPERPGSCVALWTQWRWERLRN